MSAEQDPFALAQEYRAAGWIGTVPIPHGVKWPPPRGFTGDDGAWPSGADVAAWQESGPQNIALRLPPNVIALDVDDTGGLLALTDKLGTLPPTWRAHSGGSRLGHLYYRLPAGVTSEGWGAPCFGVDLLRYGHRYSVVWPSLHPSGSRYGWSPGEVGADKAFPAPGDLPELPAAWVAHLRGDRAPDGATTMVERPRRDDFGTVGDAIPSGRHQEWLFLHACSMRARGVPEEEAAAVVRTRAKADCVPPWAGPDDPWEAVAHAYRRYPEGEPPAEPGAALTLVGAPPPTNAPALPPVAQKYLAFLDWRLLASTPLEPVDWLVPGIIAARRGHVLYAATGVGKSLLSLEWAVTMVRAGRVVLYVDHENDPRGDVWERLQAMGVDADELDGLRYLSFPEMATLDTLAGGAELLALALDVGAAVVVVDTATRTVKGEENSNDTWTAWDRHTGVALRREGIAFLRIDHAGKDAERGQRGGSNKSTDVDLVWQLSRGNQDYEFVLTNEKARIPLTEPVIAFRRLFGPLRHDRIAVPTKLENEAAKMREIWIAMDEAGLSIDPTKPDGTPWGVRKLAADVRAGAGVEGRHDLLASVAKVRWAALNNAFAPWPDWAPPRTDSVDNGGLNLAK